MKPYLIFKNKNSPFWYAQIRLPDGTLTTNKSTGKESKMEAERVVMQWIVSGNIPTTVSKKGKAIGQTSLEFVSILNGLKTRDFTDREIDEMLNVLKERKFICTAIKPEKASARDVMEYLNEFWDMEKSPYLNELKIRGKEVHFHYVQTNRTYINKYWKPLLEGKKIGEVTRNDVNRIFGEESIKHLSGKSIFSLVSALAQPMKYAHQHGLTELNCYDGIIKPSTKSKKREILTMEETRALFNAEWENQTAKLACLIACYTGMRSGEILALRMQDIGEDRIYIRHSWNQYEGLKCPKNGEEREIKIPRRLRDMIVYQASFNPYNEGMSGFIFFNAEHAERPMDSKVWIKYMRRALESIGHKDPKSICFHSFRHEWCTNTLSEIGDKRVCMVGSGHKSDEIFEHYADHIQKEKALDRLADTSERLFGDLITNVADEVEYTVSDTTVIEPIAIEDKTKAC